MRRRALNVVFTALGVLLLPGCARESALHEWEPAAARAVARSIADGAPLVVLQNQGSETGPALPWGVRQSLTTGGLPVVESVGDTAVRTLIFDDSRRDGDAWIIQARVLRSGGAQDSAMWRVTCTDHSCQAARIQ